MLVLLLIIFLFDCQRLSKLVLVSLNGDINGEGEKRREREGETGQEREVPMTGLLSTLPKQPGLGQAEARNQQLLPGFLHGWEGLKYQLLPPSALARGWLRSQTSVFRGALHLIRHRHPRWQLTPLCHNTCLLFSFS